VYRTTALENGLRILTTSMPHTRSVAAGIFVGVGSRYEKEADGGTSHLIEHMMFKGTERRPQPQQIAEAIEGLGGVMNASTGCEVTTYWAKVAHHHLPVALDVLVDIFLHSKFDAEQLEKERQVVIQEINRMLDMPESWVHVLIGELIWPEHPVGRSIAGTEESVAGITRQDLLDYIDRTYTPHNVVISLAGKLDHDDVVEQLSAEFAAWETSSPPSFLPATAATPGPRIRTEFKKSEQAHLCIGMRGLSLQDPHRFQLGVLNAILGEGMSSRLFVEIREKRGLAYSVGSYTSYLRDTGAIVLYAGVQPENAADAISAMVEQVSAMRQKTVSEGELNRAKEFTKGRILLHMEDTFANASWVGQQEVLDREFLTVDRVMHHIDAVTADDVQRQAQQLFSTEQANLAIVGPFKDPANFAASLAM